MTFRRDRGEDRDRRTSREDAIAERDLFADTANPGRAFDGVVLGWITVPIGRVGRGVESTHLLRVQTARSLAAARQGEVEEYQLVLNRTQLRQLGESLIRNADRADGRADTVSGRVLRWFG